MAGTVLSHITPEPGVAAAGALRAVTLAEAMPVWARVAALSFWVGWISAGLLLSDNCMEVDVTWASRP